MNSFIVLIPARLASTRLPNKPLADLAGLPMVVRVAKQALQSRAKRVVVAADHSSIVDACHEHQIEVLLTDEKHPSGSDRLAQACALLDLQDADCIVNVQGDEPLIDPELINAVAQLLEKHPNASVSTAAHAISDLVEFHNPNVVKVVCDSQGFAHYFSRAAIPFARDLPDQIWWDAPSQSVIDAINFEKKSHFSSFAPLRHIGIYAYRVGFLKTFPLLGQSPTEQLESLEQLRALWYGYKIAVHITEKAPMAGVDTPEDLMHVRQLLRKTRTL